MMFCCAIMQIFGTAASKNERVGFSRLCQPMCGTLFFCPTLLLATGRPRFNVSLSLPGAAPANRVARVLKSFLPRQCLQCCGGHSRSTSHDILTIVQWSCRKPCVLLSHTAHLLVDTLLQYLGPDIVHCICDSLSPGESLPTLAATYHTSGLFWHLRCCHKA